MDQEQRVKLESQYEKGMTHYRQAQKLEQAGQLTEARAAYKEAANDFKTAADDGKGLADGCYRYAVLQELFAATERTEHQKIFYKSQAAAYYQHAFNKRSNLFPGFLAKMYELGIKGEVANKTIVKKDFKKAVSCYKEAAEIKKESEKRCYLGDIGEAQYALAQYYERGEYINKDQIEAFSLYRQVARLDPTQVGECFRHEIGEAQYRLACLSCGKIKIEKLNPPLSKLLAIDWCEKAIANKCREAEELLKELMPPIICPPPPPTPEPDDKDELMALQRDVTILAPVVRKNQLRELDHDTIPFEDTFFKELHRKSGLTRDVFSTEAKSIAGVTHTFSEDEKQIRRNIFILQAQLIIKKGNAETIYDQLKTEVGKLSASALNAALEPTDKEGKPFGLVHWTPLTCAVDAGDEKQITFFLTQTQGKIDINAPSNGGITALYLALSSSSILDEKKALKLVKFLVSHGAAISVIATGLQPTVLHCCVAHDYSRCAEYLLTRKEAVPLLAIKNNHHDHRTPLMVAVAKEGSEAILAAFLPYANEELIGEALVYAAREGRKENIKFIECYLREALNKNMPANALFLATQYNRSVMDELVDYYRFQLYQSYAVVLSAVHQSITGVNKQDVIRELLSERVNVSAAKALAQRLKVYMRFRAKDEPAAQRYEAAEKVLSNWRCVNETEIKNDTAYQQLLEEAEQILTSLQQEITTTQTELENGQTRLSALEKEEKELLQKMSSQQQMQDKIHEEKANKSTLENELKEMQEEEGKLSNELDAWKAKKIDAKADKKIREANQKMGKDLLEKIEKLQTRIASKEEQLQQQQQDITAREAEFKQDAERNKQLPVELSACRQQIEQREKTLVHLQTNHHSLQASTESYRSNWLELLQEQTLGLQARAFSEALQQRLKKLYKRIHQLEEIIQDDEKENVHYNRNSKELRLKNEKLQEINYYHQVIQTRKSIMTEIENFSNEQQIKVGKQQEDFVKQFVESLQRSLGQYVALLTNEQSRENFTQQLKDLDAALKQEQENFVKMKTESADKGDNNENDDDKASSKKSSSFSGASQYASLIGHFSHRNNPSGVFSDASKNSLGSGSDSDKEELDEKDEKSGAEDITNPVSVSQLPDDYHEIDVPNDNNCLFWASALALLLPNLDDATKFNAIYARLFGDSGTIILEARTDDEKLSEKTEILINSDATKEGVRNLLRTYDCAKDTPLTYEGKVLEKLVCQIFRNRVVDRMDTLFDENFKQSIYSEAGKSNWDDYRRGMRLPTGWGGEPEIQAISQLTQTTLKIIGESGSMREYSSSAPASTIYLVHANARNVATGRKNHYHFGLSEAVRCRFVPLLQSNERLDLPASSRSLTK